MTIRQPFRGRAADDDDRGSRGGGRRRTGRWSPFIPAILAGAGAFVAVLSVVQAWPTTYAATCVVSFSHRPDAIASVDLMQVTGEKYVVIATSDELLRVAAGRLGIDVDELARSTTATLSAGTGNIEITVERPDRGEAVRATNAVADIVVDRSSSDAFSVAEVTSMATTSRAKTKPPRLLLTAVGAVASGLLAVMVGFVLIGRSRTNDAETNDRHSALDQATPALVPGPPRAGHNS